jgi:4-hydroxythreonine-4-phosphate dehydrogenase
MNEKIHLPVIGITMGDPAGIGPEIIVKTLSNSELHKICRPVIIGDAYIIEKAIRLVERGYSGPTVNKPLNTLNINIPHINIIAEPKDGHFNNNTLNLIEASKLPPDTFSPSRPGMETGVAMQDYIIKGIDLALMKKIDALVTCPITKLALKLAGSDFHGHTELLAHRTNTDNYAMMLAGSKLKVVLVTIHIPLSQVSACLSTEKIIEKIKITHVALKNRFNLEKPRIAVAGLNPHAGEDSMFGHEEEDIIVPAIRYAKTKNWDVTGPLPPDTVFYHAAQGKYDAVVCMYHDQGLIAFKMIHFKDGVNTTLGLPIIRTSVDHGTAYDIAWQGIADATSLREAVKMAALQAENSNCHSMG